jgi:hypothetical protein
MYKVKQNLRNLKGVAIAICLAGFMVFSGCKSDDDNPNPNEINDVFSNLGYVASQREADPYIFVNMEDGSSLSFYTNVETGDVKSAIYDNGSKTVLIRYGTDGLPIGAYSDNLYYILRYEGNTATTEIYNADNQKIDEQTVQSEDIAELIKDSPYLRSSALTPICVSKIFAKNAKSTYLVLDYSNSPFGVNPNDKVLLNLVTNTVEYENVCFDDPLGKNFSNNTKGWNAERFINSSNEKLTSLQQGHIDLLNLAAKAKYTHPDALNKDKNDKNGYVNPPLTEPNAAGNHISGEWSCYFSVPDAIFPITLSENGKASMLEYYTGTWNATENNMRISVTYRASEGTSIVTMNGTINENKNRITGNYAVTESDGFTENGTFVMNKIKG